MPCPAQVANVLAMILKSKELQLRSERRDTVSSHALRKQNFKEYSATIILHKWAGD